MELKNYNLHDKLKAVREFTFEILDQNSNTNVYSDINRLYRIESNIKKIIQQENINGIDVDAIFLANYFHSIEEVESNVKEIDFELIITFYKTIAIRLKEQFLIEDALIEKAEKIAIQSLPIHEATLIEAKILSDAAVMDFACPQGRERLKLLYEQLLLKDFKLSKVNWYDTIIPLIEHYKTYTDFGKTAIQPHIDELCKSLKKEKKEIENRNNLLLKKELDISDEEIKKLKKDLTKIKERDDRGIQTLFRNTSRNHYTLNRMVDDKARIMIMVNSIILSLVLGGVIGKDVDYLKEFVPAVIISIANLVSITFAILSIAPNKTQGDFTEEEIRSKKGNLLYFGNFFNMHYRDFEWAFLQMLSDKNYLYTSMIRDYYHQAQILNKKYNSIRVSLYSFLFGLAIAIVTNLVIS